MSTPIVVTGTNTAKDGGFSTDADSTSTEILAANNHRKSALIVNYSAEIIWLALGQTAVAGQGIPLQPRGDANTPSGSYEIGSANLFTGAVNAICASGGMALVCVEV